MPRRAALDAAGSTVVGVVTHDLSANVWLKWDIMNGSKS
jgi:hypothetical protein